MGELVTWGGSDMFTHMLVVGPTRCGKTATILKPIIYQLLCLKAQGVPLGLSVIEPKGDVAAMVAEMSAEMGLDCVHIDPTNPNSARFNPMEGDTDSVAEATVVVLKGLFGKQDAFFATVQELSARNVTKLLKELHGNNMDIVDVMNTLRDEKVLEEKVAQLEARDGMTDLVHFFRSELLGSMREKYRQHVIGLRAQLENITSNASLRRIMTGRSSFNIDEHYEKGGILAVNTALGLLRSSGDAFGQFVTMHLQNGAFRRPGTENTRVPHYLIVDEYSRYINPDVEIFLNLAAEYRVAGIFATQSLGQLEIESGKIGAKAMKRAILGGCRNIIVFGGIKSEDAREFAEEFGKDKIIMRQNTYKNNPFLPTMFPDSYRDTENEEYRFDATDLMELPRFHYVHRLMKDGHTQQPGVAKGTFIRRDWKEAREWEKQGSKRNSRKKGESKKVFSIFNGTLESLKKRRNKTTLVKPNQNEMENELSDKQQFAPTATLPSAEIESDSPKQQTEPISNSEETQTATNKKNQAPQQKTQSEEKTVQKQRIQDHSTQPTKTTTQSQQQKETTHQDKSYENTNQANAVRSNKKPKEESQTANQKSFKLNSSDNFW